MANLAELEQTIEEINSKVIALTNERDEKVLALKEEYREKIMPLKEELNKVLADRQKAIAGGQTVTVTPEMVTPTSKVGEL